MIRDRSIEASVLAVGVKGGELLGDRLSQYLMKPLRTMPPEPLVNDLQELLGLLDTLRTEVLKATDALLRE